MPRSDCLQDGAASRMRRKTRMNPPLTFQITESFRSVKTKQRRVLGWVKIIKWVSSVNRVDCVDQNCDGRTNEWMACGAGGGNLPEASLLVSQSRGCRSSENVKLSVVLSRITSLLKTQERGRSVYNCTFYFALMQICHKCCICFYIMSYLVQAIVRVLGFLCREIIPVECPATDAPSVATIAEPVHTSHAIA